MSGDSEVTCSDPHPSPLPRAGGGIFHVRTDQTQPVGFGNPAILQACFAGPYGNNS